MVKKEKIERFIMFDGSMLWVKTRNCEKMLGNISTRLGSLTHEQKLQAVANQGIWIKV